MKDQFNQNNEDADTYKSLRNIESVNRQGNFNRNLYDKKFFKERRQQLFC